jgi:hypothetical protein
MGRRIERRLDGDLQCVLDEPLLAYVVQNLGGPRERTELSHTRLDQSELLGDELRVRQRGAVPPPVAR